jgi:hypothetical protein
MKRAVVAIAATLVAAPSAMAIADTTPPTIAVTSPARGEFVAGSGQVTVRGTATDESGIASLTINGVPADVAGNGGWSLPVTLDFGTNVFTARAIDGANNETYTSWSYIYSPTYLPLGELVPSAVGARLSADGVNALGPVIARHVLESPLDAVGPLPGHLAFERLDCGTTTGRAAPLEAQIAVEVAALDCVLTGSGPRGSITIEAENVSIALDLVIAIDEGRFVVDVPRRPAVELVPSKRLVEVALASAIQRALPPALEAALSEAVGPRTLQFPGLTVTSMLRPTTLVVDPGSVRGWGDADVSVVAAGQPQQGPGSPSRSGAASPPPPFTSQRDLSLSLREDLVNRTLYAAWATGAGKVRIDQAHLAQFGIQLPFQLDASFLLPFFPQLGGMLAPSTPIAIALDPQLPAVVEVTGTPSLLGSSIGELWLSVQLDLGQGFVDVLTVVAHAELPADATVAGGALRIVPGVPTVLAFDVRSNPLGLPQADIDQFLRTALPMSLFVTPSVIPPLPLPLPLGLQLTNVDVRQDGARADFMTIEGDV